MRWLRYLLVFVTLFGLAAQVAAAQEEKGSGDLEEARKQWDEMDPSERRRILDAWEIWRRMPEEAQRDRRKICEDLMQADSEQDRRSLLERMKRLRKKVDQEKLDRFESYNQRFHSSLAAASPEAAERFDGLEEHFQRALYGYAFGRTFQVMREQIEEKLAPEERKRLDRFHGPEWWKQVYVHQMKWIMDDLPEEERKAIDALPPEEREQKQKTLFWKQARKNRAAAREIVAKEVADLLDAPPGELQTALNELWGYRTIRDPSKREAAFREFRNRFCHGRQHR